MDFEMAITPRSLTREIVCPICSDVLHQTRAAPDCLHRFCLKCVEKAVKKECPVCKKKLPSQVKSFRVDPNFDQLIAKITNGYHATKPIDTNKISIQGPECEVVLRSLDREQTRYIKSPENTTVDHLSRYLAIRPQNAKMPNLETEDKFGLCIMANRSTGHYEMLPGNMKLDEIKKSYNLIPDRPLELYFYSP